MAEAERFVEKFVCSICLEILKYPVTITCGHNYCMECITNHWDTQRTVYTCPQCRRYFVSRPILMKNTMLEDLIEDLKATKMQSTDTSPQDVLCDVCDGKKLKALKSCMQCLASFCEEHLQPHHKSPAFAKHKLTAPSQNLQEGICPRHNEALKMFCQKDLECICFLCSVDEHRGHETVLATVERAQREKELESRRQKILQKINNKGKYRELLENEEMAINVAADQAIGQSDERFTNLIRLVKDRKSEIEMQIRTQQQNEARHVQELIEKTDEEISNLERSKLEMELVSHISDDCLYLQKYLKLSEPVDDQETRIQSRSLQYIEGMSAAVSGLTNKLQSVLTDGLANYSVDDSRPKTRVDFLKHFRNITLDLNTANTQLALSNFDKRVTLISKHIEYPHHPERFCDWRQVLSKESLTGQCYWEVEWSGEEGVYIAVAYKSIKRQGSSIECLFGYNDKSWALYCDESNYVFWFNGVSCLVLGPRSTKVGVYLDHAAGELAFYSVSQTMTLLYKVHTKFTEDLHAGLWLYYPVGATAAFC